LSTLAAATALAPALLGQDAVTPVLRVLITVAYLLLLGLICVYGVHRYWMMRLYRRHLLDPARPADRFAELPRVTVQLPMFNEGVIGPRIIDAAVALDYPRDRLQVQVIDDSTDASADLARHAVERWARRGFDIAYLHRTDRTGFKAGALAAATPHATGAFIAIFDADFLPPRNFLKRTIHHFTDPAIGLVQTRWEHLNRGDSLLTRAQAIFLDGHFIIEQSARNRSGVYMGFNGTAGVWRRQAIADGGGWQHDTLTEDLDLSYRAQMAGWRFRFLPHVACPAELPPEINAFKSQQHRWTKGAIQCAMKILPGLLRARVPWGVKAEGFFHLTCPMVYLYITLMCLLFYPAIHLNVQFAQRGSWWGVVLGLALFGMGTVSAALYYLVAQKRRRRPVWRTALHIPLLMAVGVGIALSNAVACLEALVGHQTPFIRTPKYGRVSTPGPAPDAADPDGGSPRPSLASIPIPSLRLSVALLELVMAGYMLACIRLAWEQPAAMIGVPFLVLFAVGYGYVGVTSTWRHLQTRLKPVRVAAEPTPA
jgi:cellulose synthase/poly-beta-1,6-N-acetylglucosamine synthase-like glycosyltransferase